MIKPLYNLFSCLKDSDIQYFLLTDFDAELTSRDIDLYIDIASKREFEKIIYELGWYKRKEPSYHINHHFFLSPQSNVYLDVKYELSFACEKHKCHTYKYTENAINRSYFNSKNIRRPGSYDAVLLYAAHLAFRERGKLEAKHGYFLYEYLTDFENQHSHLPTEIFQIRNWLENEFPLNTNSLQEILHPYFRQEQKRMVQHKKKYNIGWGAKILFLGTDGAGKSTLIKAVKEKLLLKNKQLYLGTGEHGWTSTQMKKLLQWKSRNKIINKLYGFFKTYFLLPVEFLLRIVPVKIKSKYSVVLIDRIPGKIFLENSKHKQLLYKSILPKPDLVFFLNARPEILQERKPLEFSTERSLADIEKFRKVADKISGGNYISIDTSNLSISEATDLILSEIYKNHKVYENLLTARPH